MLNSHRSIRSQSSDNRLSDARNIGNLTGQKRFKGFVGLSDRVDYYSFKLAQRSSFNLSLNKLQSNVDVFLLKGKNIVARSTRSGKQSEGVNLTLDANTYYIRVSQKQGNSRYKLSLDATPAIAVNPAPVNKLVSLFTSGSSPEARLGFVDLSTGNVSLLPLGNMAGTVLKDIASFGNETFAVANPNSLYKIDSNTSTYSFVGNLASIGKTNIASLGFTSTGSLYAAGTAGDFYSIDTSTGQATLVATIPGFSASGDIAYDPGTNRFFATSRNVNGSDSLYSIGLAGDAQLIGNIGFSNVWGLLFENGVLYGFTPQQQLKIDLATGVGTFDRSITATGSSPSVGGAA